MWTITRISLQHLEVNMYYNYTTLALESHRTEFIYPDPITSLSYDLEQVNFSFLIERYAFLCKVLV